MSGETKEDVSAWTIDSLHQHLTVLLETHRREYINGMDDIRRDYETALKAMEKALDAAFLASEKAIDKAEKATHERFASVNEFRDQLSDQAALFMPRQEAIAAIERNQATLAALSNQMHNFMTRESAEALSERNAERIDELKERMDRSEGHTTGMAAGWGYLLGGIAALSTIALVILAVIAT